MSHLHPSQSVILNSHRTPHSFFNSTHLSFQSIHPSTLRDPLKLSWQSRRARKGRLPPTPARIHQNEADERPLAVTARLQRNESKLQLRFQADISFWLAVTFTFGSAVWVVNGFLTWIPILRPHLDSVSFSRTAAATAFIGGSVFEVGSYLMVVEALDRGREIKRKTTLGELLHHQRQTDCYPRATFQEEKLHEEDSIGRAGSWIWWGRPMWHDMGYMAAIIQLFAATIFWVSTLTGLPGVISGFYDGTASTPIVDIFFWTPQVIGGTGFIISSLILMLEVQKEWYHPKIGDIGWHIGFWNLIGALGFTLCGALGYSSSSRAEYQSALSTWWGSWAFLIGSVIQCGEALWRA